MKPFLIFIAAIFSSFFLMAQDEIPTVTDSTSTPTIALDTIPKSELLASDTSAQKKKRKKRLRNFFRKDYPNPKRAMLLSFVIPGAGQAYNKKYWKIPIAMGGTATMIYFVSANTRTYRILRDEYSRRFDEDSTIPADLRFVNWANEDVKAERDRRNKWKEMSYIGLVLVQALGGVDAFVDAHLAGYEINEDLSMKLKPSFQTTIADGTALGVGLSFYITAPTPPQPKDFFNTAR